MPRRFALAIALTLTTVIGAVLYSFGGFGWHVGDAGSSTRQIIQIVDATAQPAAQDASTGAITVSDTSTQSTDDELASFDDDGAEDADGAAQENHDERGDDNGSEVEDD